MRCASTRTTCSATTSSTSCVRPAAERAPTTRPTLAAYGEAEWRIARRRDADGGPARRDAVGRLPRQRRRRVLAARTRWSAATCRSRATLGAGQHLVRDAQPRLQGGRLQHRRVRPGGPARVRSRVPVEPRDGPALAQRRERRCRRTLARLLHVARATSRCRRRTSSIRAIRCPTSSTPTTPRSGRNYGLEASLAWQRAAVAAARRDAGAARSRVPRLPLRRPQPRRPRAGAVRRGYQYSLSARVGRRAGLDGARRRDRRATRSTSTPATTSGRSRTRS